MRPLLRDGDHDYLFFHAYYGAGLGRGSALQISTMVWEDGWPRVGVTALSARTVNPRAPAFVAARSASRRRGYLERARHDIPLCAEQAPVFAVDRDLHRPGIARADRRGATGRKRDALTGLQFALGRLDTVDDNSYPHAAHRKNLGAGRTGLRGSRRLTIG